MFLVSSGTNFVKWARSLRVEFMVDSTLVEDSWRSDGLNFRGHGSFRTL
jgi:hypothetical protein